MRVIGEQVVTAAHGHSLLQKSRQCVADLFGRNRIFNGRGSGLMETPPCGFSLLCGYCYNPLWRNRWASKNNPTRTTARSCPPSSPSSRLGNKTCNKLNDRKIIAVEAPAPPPLAEDKNLLKCCAKLRGRALSTINVLPKESRVRGGRELRLRGVFVGLARIFARFHARRRTCSLLKFIRRRPRDGDADEVSFVAIRNVMSDARLKGRPQLRPLKCDNKCQVPKQRLTQFILKKEILRRNWNKVKNVSKLRRVPPRLRRCATTILFYIIINHRFRRPPAITQRADIELVSRAKDFATRPIRCGALAAFQRAATTNRGQANRLLHHACTDCSDNGCARYKHPTAGSRLPTAFSFRLRSLALKPLTLTQC
ncbi:hypothetical protein EVAR_13157_1 [Eumeta japonica]|uniref:Uncharacterized protein n=1 Tax=Eumeta variegata TaxID=151549 RepID=A0A4C1UB39_EUMVA|nr:hypothetical protein EVAR_13157_1 [Eumeta japonica]